MSRDLIDEFYSTATTEEIAQAELNVGAYMPSCDPLPELAPALPNKREQEKTRLLAIISDPEESTLCRALAGEELFALGRLVECDAQLKLLESVLSSGSPVRRQAG